MTTRRWLLVLVATAAVSITATVFGGRILDDEAPVVGALSVTIRSTVLGENREFFVHLPEGYDADTTTRYPVLYVLDGISQSAHTAESAGLLARIGVVPPMIIVGVPNINGETRNRDYTPPEMRLDADVPTSPMGAADRFLSFLQTELVGRIDHDYRTTRPRMLAGSSRGALFVVYAAVVAPSLFEAAFAHSPALWRENDLMVTRLQGALTGGALPAGLLYLSLGDQESEKMTASFRHAVTVLERHAPATLRWRADFSVGGQHQSNPRLSTPVGLCVMFGGDQSCQGNGTRVTGRSLAAAQPVPADRASRR